MKQNGEIEPLAVVGPFAVIEPESLFIQVPEQMKRFYADIGSTQRALE